MRCFKTQMKSLTLLIGFLLPAIAFAEIPNCTEGRYRYIRIYIFRTQYNIISKLHHLKYLHLVNIRGILQDYEFYLEASLCDEHDKILSELGPLVKKYQATVRCPKLENQWR